MSFIGELCFVSLQMPLIDLYKVFAIITALAFGSFANVLIHRIPLNQSIFRPGSHCPACNYFLKWYEKIPLLSFFFLRGKCSNCGSKISSRYPLIELITALCFLPFLTNSSPKENLFVLVIITITISLASIDYQKKILPLGLSFAGIIFVSAFTILHGPYFYLAPQSMLSKSVIVLKNLGLIMFLLDSAVHLCNQFFFKERAEVISSSALHLRSKFLDKNISWVYIGILALILILYLKQKFLFLDYLFAALGLSYLVNEVIFDYFLANKAEQKLDDAEAKKTILGGGDIAMMGFISVSLGYINALFVLLAAFYICFFFLVIAKVKNLWSKSKSQSSKSNAEISFGPALALAMIADMILIRGVM